MKTKKKEMKGKMKARKDAMKAKRHEMEGKMKAHKDARKTPSRSHCSDVSSYCCAMSSRNRVRRLPGPLEIFPPEGRSMLRTSRIEVGVEQTLRGSTLHHDVTLSTEITSSDNRFIDPITCLVPPWAFC
jgi:hypothetical protein